MEERRDETLQTLPTPNARAEWIAKLRYTKSFLAKLCLSDKSLKETYCALFNALTAYEGVSAKTAFSGVTFKYKRQQLAMITLTGKSLTVYFAVEPSTHGAGRYRLTDVSIKKRFSRVPSKLRVKSAGALRFALKVVQEAAAAASLQERVQAQHPVTPRDFPSDSIGSLISRGLIRTMGGNQRPGRVMKEIPLYVEKESVRTRFVDEAAGEGKEGTAEGKNNEVAATSEGAGEAFGGETSGGESALGGESGVAANANDVFGDTVTSGSALIGRHGEYDELMRCFTGEGEVRFVKQKIIRSVDESWVSAIEDCLSSLDEVTRNPSHFIEESEELLPIERTKRVTTRSIKHLCEHTGLISRIEGDMVIPSKLLNVFRDESVMTYENKFINTLLHRLLDFVTIRYEEALEFGANRKKHIFRYSDKIENGEEKGKVEFYLEVSVPSGEKEKGAFFQSDLWARVLKLKSVISDYCGSEFANMMGNAFIRPPVVRTNPILKNKNLRECLELWEFLEGYDDDAAGVSTQETELDVSDVQLNFTMRNAAAQYMLFRKFAGLEGDITAPVKGAEEAALPKATAEQPSLTTAEVLPDKQEDETVFWVEVALQAEALALTEWKEEQARLAEERERLLAEAEKEKEEKERMERERVKPTVDDLPAEYNAYTPAEFEETAVAADAAPNEEAEEEEAAEELEDVVLYVKSFVAKLRVSPEEIKDAYCDIANAFLSKAGVRERQAFDHMDFCKGRRTIARVMLSGKTLRVYFMPLAEELKTKYGVEEVTDVKKFAATPCLLKVKGSRSLKKVLDLIAEVNIGADAKVPVVKNKSDYEARTTEESLLMGEVRRRILSAIERERLQRMRRRPEAPREEYDYTEEVAEYNKKKARKAAKAKELVMTENVTSSEIKHALVTAEAQEIVSTEEPKKPVLEGADGDPLYARSEALSDAAVSLVEPKKETVEEPKKPVEVQPDGDILYPKPIIMVDGKVVQNFSNVRPKSEAPAPAPLTAPQEQKKKGFLSRLFGRRDKK